MTIIRQEPYSHNYNNSLTVAAGVRAVIKFLDKDGGLARGRAGDIRANDLSGGLFTGKLHYKYFDRHLQTNYACDEFSVVGTDYYIYLDIGQERYQRDFLPNDKLVVTGTAAGTNDGTFTVSAIDRAFSIDEFAVTAGPVYTIKLEAKEGDRSGDWSATDVIRVVGGINAENNGPFTVVSTAFAAGKTEIVVTELIVAETSSPATLDAARVRLTVVEAVANQTGSAGVADNTVTDDHFFVYAESSFRDFPNYIAEIHVLNADGAQSAKVYADIDSDEDISGSTFT